MKQHVFAFIAGVVFASGLAVSGMSQPSKVKGFLDFFGEWDMTLLFVLGPAVGIYLLGTRLAKAFAPKRFGSSPAPEKMGLRFVLGSVLFGVGWGLIGMCPGPALVMLGQGSVPVLSFFVCLSLGIAVSDRILAKL